ncbi:FAD binding domain protein [Penicillium malachiteum]|uniref:FAD binding domain protein n=1 Tax=Penicillium malachiteum TaxID=1324776 RepID=A0AAD6MXY0_9EURO|nr:FAD binding domain protein [Penicillium malachiteum]
MGRRSYGALLFAAAIVPLAIWLKAGPQSPSCRCYPGDPCWPSANKWESLNVSLSGNLISVEPIGSLAGQFLKHTLVTHLRRWQLDGVTDPAHPESLCTIGHLAQYTANVTSAADVKEVLEFVKKHNIHLVIRNTSHDYLERSTGAGAVNLWTHNLKSIETIPSYASSGYNGPAMKIGAGIQGFEAQNAAHESGYVIVTGLCPDVGIAGGYTQGGGHGSLASRYGLSADQVLEWEVITAGGELKTASPTQNSDLYWALSGGGGGTYAVVLSMMVRVYPEEENSVAS